MKSDLIFEYLKARSEILNEEFNLNQIKDLEEPFDNGSRLLYGITVNEMCFPLWDISLPNDHRGVLNAFINYYITKHYAPLNEFNINLN
jgi:hypothetical protein